MNLHEFQAKQLFKQYNIPVANGQVVSQVSDVADAIEKIGGKKWVAKVQVHAGGRGKSGGVRLVDSVDEAQSFAKEFLGTQFVTFQTDEKGQKVNQVLFEPCSDIENELYLGAVIDRSSRKITFMASTEGGVNIEEVAHNTPEKIHKIQIDTVCSYMPHQARFLSKKLGLNKNQSAQLNHLLKNLTQLFIEKDLSLVEVNPLIINTNGDLFCLDAKINVDESALYRQNEVAQMRDTTQEDERELEASKWDLNYVALDGSIGCMVNGAGLAMATMDLIQLHGGFPANFLDVGGTATEQRVTEAFKIILKDKNVKAILVNIFGGIVRCDLIAEGIVGAIKQAGVKVPVVVRLEGNKADIGLKILKDSGVDVQTSQDFDAATKMVVSLAK